MKISGPTVLARGLEDASLYEAVRVGGERLFNWEIGTVEKELSFSVVGLHPLVSKGASDWTRVVDLLEGPVLEETRVRLTAVEEGQAPPLRERGLEKVRELLHAIRHRGGTPVEAAEEAAVVLGDPSELEAVRAALACDLAGCAVRVTRLPSGRFRFLPDPQTRPEASQKLQILAQEIAVSCDRFIEMRGVTTFGFVTESVARWQYGTEQGARRLASELFPGPDTAITHLGLHPFGGEGTVFFAYEGSETVWEAAYKGITCVTVRDIHEYGRILREIRRGA